MKKIILGIVLISAIVAFKPFASAEKDKKERLIEYLKFIEKVDVSPKEYLLGLYKTHDLVMLCEREHSEMTQYDLILDLIADQYFIDNVGAIFMEIGTCKIEKEIHDFLKKENLSEKEIHDHVIEICREASFYSLWNCYNYYKLLYQVYLINQNLSADKKVLIYPCDRYFSWDQINTTEECRAFRDIPYLRDSIMARNLIEGFYALKEKNTKQKAFIIMNFFHSFTNIYWDKEKTVKNRCTGGYLKEEFGDNLVSVLLNERKCSKSPFTRPSAPVQGGMWDAVFKYNGNKPIGFDLKGSPFGKDYYDMVENMITQVLEETIEYDLNYQDVFHGFIFYKPFEDLEMRWGIPGIITKDWEEEISRRLSIELGKELPIDTIYNWYNEFDIRKTFNLSNIQAEIDTHFQTLVEINAEEK